MKSHRNLTKMRMKTKNYLILFQLTVLILFLGISSHILAFNVTSEVLTGKGKIELFKNGKKVVPATEFAAGDTLIVFASPSDNESLSFLMIGDNIYYSSPIFVEVKNNISIQAGFEAKKILFKETFGTAQAFVTQLGGGESASAYTGYDTPADIATISTINGQTSNSKIHNYARNTNDPAYNPENENNPNTTHVYLQVSNMAIRFAAGKELVGENIQIKFRHAPVRSNESNNYYNYNGLQLKLNNTAFTALEYGNSVKMQLFWSNIDNPGDPESTGIGNSSTYLAPFVVIPVPANYTGIASIMITQASQSTPFNNRCRIDDIIIVADGEPTNVENAYMPAMYAVVSDFDVEFKGAMKMGDPITLYNISGTAVKTQLVASDRVLIPTNDLPAGVYIASVKDIRGEINSFKIILK